MTTNYADAVNVAFEELEAYRKSHVYQGQCTDNVIMADFRISNETSDFIRQRCDESRRMRDRSNNIVYT